MANSKQIVYLSQIQYAELIANGTITVNGVTVTYDENDIYVTPQAEPVTDVRVAGTSVAANGVADIPIASGNNYGVIKVGANAYGLMLRNDGTIQTVMASNADMKSGSRANQVISPQAQHLAAFYGLAKAAGHDEKDSTEPLGTYTPEAKGAIQKMLGVSDLIATEENDLTASKAYAIGDIFTANGKLYKATAAIAQDAAIILPDGVGANCEETTLADENIKDVQVNGTSVVTDRVASIPTADANQYGTVKVSSNLGVVVGASNCLSIQAASTSHVKAGTTNLYPIAPNTAHSTAFYGLAKAAGDTTQSSSSNAVGEYTDEAKIAIQKMLGIYEAPWELIRKDTVTNAESADINITVDGNGNPLELTDCIIKLWTPNQTADVIISDYGRVYFRENNVDIGQIFLVNNGSMTISGRYVAFGSITQVNNLVSLEYIEWQTTSSHAVARRTLFAGAEDYNGDPYKVHAPFIIDNIKIKAITGTISYKLYGKRKWQ